MPTYDENGALLITGAGILADHQHSAVGDGGPLAVGVTDTDLTAGSVWFAGVGGVLQEDANLFWDDASNELGIRTNTPAAAVDIWAGGDISLIIGADSGANTRTDATAKSSRFGHPHYTNAEEPLGLLVALSNAGSSIVWMGGGTATFNAATQLRFMTAANTTTTTGTERVRINESGDVGIGTVTISRRLHAVDESASTGIVIPIARLESQVSGGAGAAGHGPSLELYGESSTTLNQSMGSLAAVWSVATHASRRSRLEFRAAYIGTDVLCGVIVAPTSAPADGNARGEGAVDLQPRRGAVTNVASGASSVIGGGDSNTSSNTYTVVSGGISNIASGNAATVGGGNSNDATNTQATVGGGFTNVASGAVSVIAGGNQNTASGSNAAIGGGDENLASGSRSTVPGGFRAVADKYGQLAQSAGRFAANGDAQRSAFVARRDVTTHAVGTWYSLWLDGVAEQMTIAASSAWTFRALVIGITANAAQQWGYEVVGLIERDNAGNTTLAASTTSTIFESDANYDAQSVADNVNEALEIQVRRTGGVDYSVQWVAVIHTVECTHT